MAGDRATQEPSVSRNLVSLRHHNVSKGNDVVYFTLLAPMIQEKILLGDECSCIGRSDHSDVSKRRRWPRCGWSAFEMLARNITTEMTASTYRLHHALLPHANTTRSRLELLPTEVVASILDDHFLTDSEVLALGLCSKNLWMQVVAHIKRTRPRDGRLAGTPLICTEYYVGPLPDSIIGLFPSMPTDSRFFPIPPMPRTHVNEFLWNYRCRFMFKHCVGTDALSRWMRAFEAVTALPCGVDEMHLELLREGLLDLFMVDQSAECLLRNLDTRQYVTLEQQRGVGGLVSNAFHVKGLPWLSLDQALLLRICWGDLRPSDIDEKTRKLRRGVWAGHRFDVVFDDSVRASGDWRDVTCEFVDEGKLWATDLAVSGSS